MAQLNGILILTQLALTVFGFLDSNSQFLENDSGIMNQMSSPVLVIGGQQLKSVEIVGSTTDQEGTSISDVPFFTQGAIGFLDKDKRPMVCGGSRNTWSPRGCHVYMEESNTWERGPIMKRKRIQSSVTCLHNGTCWIFGGQKMAVSEYYDPDDGTFKIGPLMPEKRIHSFCSVLGPSGKIYLIYGKENRKIRYYTFDPEDGTFDQFLSQQNLIDGEIGPGKLSKSTCGVVTDGDKEYFVSLGGVFMHNGTARKRTITVDPSNGRIVTRYLPSFPDGDGLFGAGSFQLGDTFVVIGGQLNNGSWILQAQTPSEGTWSDVDGFHLSQGRESPIVIVYEN